MLINGKEDVSEFDSKSDGGVFVGYSTNNKSYRIFNKRTLCIEESVHVIFDESGSLENPSNTNDMDLEEII